MNLEFLVYVERLKNNINRTIIANDTMSLYDFCESIIISMNGKCKHDYSLEVADETIIMNSIRDEEMLSLTLKDLKLQKSDELRLAYNFNACWRFTIIITNITESLNQKDFEVVDGKGVGIIDNEHKNFFDLLNIFDKKELERFQDYYGKRKWFIEYMEKNFNVDETNKEIEKYFSNKLSKQKPAHYIMNVTLEGFTKEIKRKISVDSNMMLDNFTMRVIVSMRGDLSHLYNIIVNKEYLDDNMINAHDLTFLDLQEKSKFKIEYDFGDGWIFNISVSKVLEGYGTKKFEVLSGKGYGIVEDCGGIWGLAELFKRYNNETNDEDDDEGYWGSYDINEFDLEEINETIDRRFR